MRHLDIEPYILARHGDLIVINKPHDWPTSGRTLEDDDCIQFHLMKHLGEMVWAIHQLDADTSGLCLFTRNKNMVTKVKAIMADPLTRKEYYAIVKGEPTWNRYDERSPIGKVSETSLGVTSEGKAARTAFEVLDKSQGYSLIRARIYTGRTHQIRIHLSHLGIPVLGEEWYGAEPCQIHIRQALHAHRLFFAPNEVIAVSSFTAPVPKDMLQLSQRFNLRFG